MPTGEALFAASEIASALGITPQAVHKQMRGIPPGVKIMRGVRASAWPASAFPKEQRALLDAIATRKGYRGPCHVVSDPPSRWHPEIPFAEIAPHCLNTASQRRNLLTPILREHHTKKVEEIVRLALAAPGGEMFSASSLRRYITLAKFRDRGQRGRKSSRSRKAERPCGRGWRNQRKNEHPESAEKLASASREVRQFDGAAQRSPR